MKIDIGKTLVFLLGVALVMSFIMAIAHFGYAIILSILVIGKVSWFPSSYVDLAIKYGIQYMVIFVILAAYTEGLHYILVTRNKGKKNDSQANSVLHN